MSGARVEDWPRRLDVCIEAARHRPFEWGRHDCALFAAEVVRALRGVDYAAEHRGKYAGPASALRRARRIGGLALLATRHLGEPVAVALARRGDVVLYCDESGPSLGVCVGSEAAFPGEAGLVFRPLLACVQAWRV